MKRIAVSACFLYPDKNRKVFGPKTLTYLERDMSRYLARPDVLPIMVPDLKDEDLLPFLSELDGLVLQGGDDLSPHTYGEEPIENGRWLGDPHRDAYELKLLDLFIKAGKPVYGICRGFQLINAYFGGTLYQDLETQLPEAKAHRSAELYDQIYHEIELVPGLLLDQLHGNEPTRLVNTVHHQAIKTLGKDLEVLAYSVPDRLIEAFHWTGAEAGKVSAVQWHPEFFWNLQDGATLINAHKQYEHFLSFID